jgi:hypothetical protein
LREGGVHSIKPGRGAAAGAVFAQAALDRAQQDAHDHALQRRIILYEIAAGSSAAAWARTTPTAAAATAAARDRSDCAQSLREATLYTAWRGGDQRLQLYVTRGFAQVSPDWAVGVTWRYRF